MRIALVSDSTVYPLAGEDGVSERVHSSAADFQISPQADEQEVRRVRASYTKMIDRANLLTTISFSTTRLFATPAEAELYALDYDRVMPRTGVLVMTETGPGGIMESQQMADALVNPPSRRCIGCTVILNYVVTGGKITVVLTDYLLVTGELSIVSTPVVFPPFLQSIDYNGRPSYSDTGADDSVINIYWTGTVWYLEYDGTSSKWRSFDDVATPDLCTTWEPTGDAHGIPTVTAY